MVWFSTSHPDSGSTCHPAWDTAVTPLRGRGASPMGRVQRVRPHTLCHNAGDCPHGRARRRAPGGGARRTRGPPVWTGAHDGAKIKGAHGRRAVHGVVGPPERPPATRGRGGMADAPDLGSGGLVPWEF